MSIGEFLTKKHLQIQYEEGRKITIKEFANELGISQPLMTQLMNGSRNLSPKNKKAIVEYFGEEALIAMGDDPHLHTIKQVWHKLSTKEKEYFRKKIVAAAEENKSPNS